MSRHPLRHQRDSSKLQCFIYIISIKNLSFTQWFYDVIYLLSASKPTFKYFSLDSGLKLDFSSQEILKHSVFVISRVFTVADFLGMFVVCWSVWIKKIFLKICVMPLGFHLCTYKQFPIVRSCSVCVLMLCLLVACLQIVAAAPIIMPKTPYMTSPTVTLYWHRANQCRFPALTSQSRGTCEPLASLQGGRSDHSDTEAFQKKLLCI